LEGRRRRRGQHVLPAARQAAGEISGARRQREQRFDGQYAVSERAGLGHDRGSRAGGALMPSKAIPLLIVAGLLVLGAATSLFTVSEAEMAIRTEFSAIVAVERTPGLHGKWPWDQIVKFDRRILSQSYTGETFLTNDNRGLIVDFYVKWR